jgi:hypothetical protein
MTMPLALHAATDVYGQVRICVNDLNSETADAYWTVGLRGGFKPSLGRLELSEFARVNNLVNAESIGAVNVSNGRYDHPALGDLLPGGRDPGLCLLAGAARHGWQGTRRSAKDLALGLGSRHPLGPDRKCVPVAGVDAPPGGFGQTTELAAQAPTRPAVLRCVPPCGNPCQSRTAQCLRRTCYSAGALPLPPTVISRRMRSPFPAALVAANLLRPILQVTIKFRRFQV